MAGFALHGVIGATGSGKSAVALRLAEQLGGEILAVDSMTVYRGMDIGTAKPTAAERARVVHHGLDLVDAGEAFTARRFVEYADGVVEDCRRRGIPLVAVGGTPLYWKSWLEGIFDGPSADPALRAELDALPTEALVAELQRVDPASADRLHANDRRRLTRAVEVHRLTGTPISALQEQWATPTRRFEIDLVGLRWDRPTLNRRINARCKQMIADGWLDEVRRLGPLGPTASEAVGYKLLGDHLTGRLSLDDAVEQIKIRTRQLAKRQMTWFRRFAGVAWRDNAET
ncbi:MAG: tRNA (adenosine(37)-N6)-dimethylallyltransferase MiaA, partial [Planctomycetota bacterium]